MGRGAVVACLRAQGAEVHAHVRPDSPQPDRWRMRARGRVEAALKTCGLPFTVARPSFITGPDHDESRPLERVGAVITDAMHTRPLRRETPARPLPTDNTTLAATLVRLAADPHAANRTSESEDLRDRPSATAP